MGDRRCDDHSEGENLRLPVSELSGNHLTFVMLEPARKPGDGDHSWCHEEAK